MIFEKVPLVTSCNHEDSAAFLLARFFPIPPSVFLEEQIRMATIPSQRFVPYGHDLLQCCFKCLIPCVALAQSFSISFSFSVASLHSQLPIHCFPPPVLRCSSRSPVQDSG